MNILPPKTRHKIFSPARVNAIARNTLLELVRLKVFYFLLLFALLIIAAAGFTSIFDFPFQEQFQILKDVSLGSMSIFTMLLAILATAMMLPKEIEDRTIYTILAKPVPRIEYMMGKLLGVFFLLFISTLMMSVMFVLALYTKEHTVLRAAMHQASGANSEQAELIALEISSIKSHAFTMSMIPGITIIYFKAVLFAAFTMLISTFASSSIFTIFISFTAYFIGSIEGMARDYWVSSGTAGLGTKIFLWAVALLFPDLQLFNLVDDIVAGNTIALDLFLKTAGLGIAYISVYSFVAYVVFAFKEL